MATVKSVTVTMTETVIYERTYTAQELADVLGVEPEQASQALDEGNETYGTADGTNALLEDILGSMSRVPDREWSFEVTND